MAALQRFWNHPAGPKTIHFWAPTFKWGITIANLADMQKPAENISYPQQIAVTATGLIWSRFSTQITPVAVAVRVIRPCAISDNNCSVDPGCWSHYFHQEVNYNLLAVNVGMAITGITQLTRKLRHEYGMDAGSGGGTALLQLKSK